MAKPKEGVYVFSDFSGGRNGADAPLGPNFGPNQVVDAVNVEWYRTAGGKKRDGSTNISMTGSGIGGQVGWLGRFVPGTSEADAELWALDATAPNVFTRLDNSVTWVDITPTDAPAAALNEITSTSLNGLFFIGYSTVGGAGVDRLHCYDPTSGTLRRTGIAPGSNAPTVANTGVGAYGATIRYYRVRWSNTTSIFSEPTASVSFTPSGAGTAARVTKPTTPTNEYITSWRVEGSADNVTFYALGDTAIGTTTYDDSVAPGSYSGGTASAVTGTYSLQKAYKFVAADSGRLLGFGNYTVAGKQNRIELSAIVGSLDKGDAERVDTTSTWYYDLDENDSGRPTALVGPLWGNFYPFKSRQMWEMQPTGSPSSPYRVTPITKELGCVGPKAAAIGEDEVGNPCLYFMSHRGVYRYGLNGLTYVSRGIEDLLLGPTSTMNMAATAVIAHMVYHPDKRQLWVWHATGSNNGTDTLSVLNVQTGGWARYTNEGGSGAGLTGARCSVMFARSIAASMGFPLCPYIGQSGANNRVTRCDDAGVTQDAGSTNYQAYITTRPVEPAGANYKGGVGDALVLAPAASGVTLTVTLTPDFLASPSKSGTALLTAAGSEARVTRRCEDSHIGDAQFVQVTIGDAAAINNAWSFDRVVLPLGPGAEPIA